MTIAVTDDRTRLERLHHFLASATSDASTAMCRWTQGLVSITLDEVRDVPLEEISEALQIGDELLTMIVLTMTAEVGGNLILVFDEASGRQLAGTLLGQKGEMGTEWTELERSALCETGNILTGAYMNGITRLIGVDAIPSPPYFVQDFGASVLEQAILEQAAAGDQVMLCQLGFRLRDEKLDWRLVFVPSQGMRHAIQRALGDSDGKSGVETE